eukprot:5012497-Amphidinium_carterae.1
MYIPKGQVVGIQPRTKPRTKRPIQGKDESIRFALPWAEDGPDIPHNMYNKLDGTFCRSLAKGIGSTFSWLPGES